VNEQRRRRLKLTAGIGEVTDATT